MRSRTNHLEDNWIGVQDARKRKQIQDRLAQRAHRLREYFPYTPATRNARLLLPVITFRYSETRNGSRRLTAKDSGKRLAERSSGLENEETGAVPDAATAVSKWSGGLVGCEDFTLSPDIAILQYPSPANSPAGACETPLDYSRGLALSSDHSLIPHGSISVYTALYNNGRILGIPCSCAAASKSLPAGPHIPLSLRPIPLQLETVHYELIDRFPFPRMRYNMIFLFEHYNIEDFVADLFMTSTFTIKPGGESWDPGAWRVDIDFNAKWGFLFAGSVPMNRPV